MDQTLREQVARMHAGVCSGLADPNRILILYALNEHPFAVTELAEYVGTLQPTVSRHLKVLRERGLVTTEREGQYVIYHLADQRVIQALELLRQVMASQIENRANLARKQTEVLYAEQN